MNGTRPRSPLQLGNLSASGNLRGLSLQSSSPIPDPQSLRVGLGSGSLSAFVRDSVSVADRRLPYGSPIGQAFYDPARTAPTAAFLQGQEAGLPRSDMGFAGIQSGATRSDTGASEILPGQLAYTAPINRRLESRAGFADPFTLPNVTEQSSLTSSLFGVERPKIGPREMGDSWRRNPRNELGTPLNTASRFDAEFRADAEGRPDDRLGAPVDAVLRGDSKRLLWPRMGERVGDAASETPRDAAVTQLLELSRMGRTVRESGRPIELEQPSVGAPALRDTTMLPGNDVFTDMRLALSLSENPKSPWFSDMIEAAKSSPSLTGQMQRLDALDAETFMRKMLDAPLKSFVGQAPSVINDEMLKAESLMEIGQYFEATRRYEAAGRIDPGNPLPLIGKAHAQLAAGEYLSASLSLIRGLERFPEVARFQIDLAALLGGGEIVDIRRADIMSRLNQHEDPRLRFLLGYLEYFSGNRTSGIENFQKAAEQSDLGSLISRFPSLLRKGAAIPPSGTDAPPAPTPRPDAEPPSENP